VEKFKRVCILELDNVDRNCDIMKASDLCQNNHIMTGNENWDFYYNFTDDELKKLIKLGADIEVLYNIELHEFSNPDELQKYIHTNNDRYIDNDGYFVLIQGGDND